ncbi:hypothetical protein V6U90_25165 [Micromonospora sp. CPCC 206060]|uniref:hypothetical protein n=1 Tax=Micromonospora sp. CPCC 206060 TaxID=3122406 RepID=UPI002FF0D97A
MKPVTSSACATTAPVRIEQADPDRIVARIRPDLADPVFAGHYPGFPLLPGVHIFEFVHRAVVEAVPHLVLDEVVCCRFLLPVDCDEELVVTVRRDGDLHSGVVAVAGTPVAEILLRYRNEE